MSDRSNSPSPSKIDRPVSRYDGSHISKDVREKLQGMKPEVRRRVLDVADVDRANPNKIDTDR